MGQSRLGCVTDKRSGTVLPIRHDPGGRDGASGRLVCGFCTAVLPAGRAVSVLSLKNYLGVDCDVERTIAAYNGPRKADLDPDR